MRKSQSLDMEQRQVQRLTRQHLQFVRLLEMTAPEVDEAVSRELEENPALEVAEEKVPSEAKTEDGEAFSETSEELQRADYAHDDDVPPIFPLQRRQRRDDEREFVTPDTVTSLYDDLTAQIELRELPDDVMAFAHFLIGNIDSNGYLRRPLASLLSDYLFSGGDDLPASTGEAALEAVKSLDPPGIGAADLQEALLLQLRRMSRSETRDLALRIIGEEFEAFSKKHSHTLISHLKASAEEVAAAMDLIRTLNPKPGATLGSGMINRAVPLIPDFIIDNDEGEITVTLNNRFPELRIEAGFEEAVRRMEARAREPKRKGVDFIMSRYNDARDFIRILRHRQETLFAVMAAIVKLQKDYFLSEDVRQLKPMMIKDVQRLTNLDISVISRATNNKYALTPWGIFPLRHFFSNEVGAEGGEVSNKQIKEEMRRMIEAEDKRHPLSDEKLTEILQGMGYELSRRTVAKYRDAMQIPVSRLRRES